ncbi:uncharacterized protein LOC128991176 isoform X2 [Macrosteles quadrilineatus]|uniref:uncharacterized protein LOC128990081 isoform X2 n=1 Tax=Macrosteles quadrilineatus TaxID=74068 RepID=UPI0023E0B6A9|nr:uncharacterized protein LOC128990081 isoform X2 [Macrosteles quadrilineatus]XP_054269932.1 uncharacterized protein LOC128991176 isoform X2 [Macrosteles quadrilineatus]
MIRLVLVASFILILGSYEAKNAPNYLPLKNDETHPTYRSIEGKAEETLAEAAKTAAQATLMATFATAVAIPSLVGWVGYKTLQYGAGKATDYAVQKAHEAVHNAVEGEMRKAFS